MAEHPLVTIETTAGPIVLELRPDAAPVTVDNFLHYVDAGFYAGTVWHRVVPGFVAQAGGYTADGRQKQALRPPIPLERSDLRHEDAALGMARLPQPADSATSEFYLCDGAQGDLDAEYCVFGRLVDGRDALRRILSAPTDPNDRPKDPPVILRAYRGRPDPDNPAPVHKAAAKEIPDEVQEVRAAAKKLRGRMALLKSRKPMSALSEVEKAISQADRSGKTQDLERARMLLEAKEKRG